MSEIRIHPAAEAYRLMTDEELMSLADDIKTNGLHDAITIGRVNGEASDAVVDGRNRLKACGIAGIEPHFEVREFKDEGELIAFVKSRSERRDLSKGQRAMGLALLYPEPEKGGRGKKSAVNTATETMGVSKSRVEQARAVARHSLELALAVRDGIMKLDEALVVVKKAREIIETDETQLERLRSEAPDLSELVEEDRMKLTEAIIVLNERKADLDRKRRTATDLLARFVNAWHPREADPQQWAERMTEDVFPDYWPPDGVALTKKNLEQTARVFAAIANMATRWEKSK
jgi:hypothetical protein